MIMTKEEKVKLKQERAFRRKSKRVEKDKSYLQTAWSHDKSSLSWGRKKQQGRVFTCEMGYYDCERRMYCNGDC